MFLKIVGVAWLRLARPSSMPKLLAAAVKTNLSGNDDETSQDLDVILGSLFCEVMNLSRFWS